MKIYLIFGVVNDGTVLNQRKISVSEFDVVWLI